MFCEANGEGCKEVAALPAPAVATEHEQAAIDESERLVAGYERGGQSCAYDCLVAGEPDCVSGA